jgi:hypothetical protein
MDVERVKEILKDKFPKGSTAYTYVTKVAPTGMSRHIMVAGSDRKGHVQNVSWYIAKLLDWKYKDNTRSVFVGGCGMDMGFHLVYTLSSKLYDDGYAIEQQWL